MDVETVLAPAEIAVLNRRDLSATVCVVFDVLRATSTFLTALANGARGIYPVLSPGEARDLQRSRLPDALLGGERGGVRVEGFDLGNSPREYTPGMVSGRDIISTTTNGTVALRACAGASEVHAGALLNLGALAAWLISRQPARLLLVCAGTGSRFAIEDGFAAGALISRLDAAHVDDAGRALAMLYEQARDRPRAILESSENGRRLREIGLGADVDWCAQCDRLDRVAILREGGAMESPQAGNASIGG